MAFKNQRNSREDNSKKPRSSSENFKSGGGKGKPTSFSKRNETGNSSYGKSEERGTFGKSKPFKKYGEDKAGNFEGKSRPFKKYGEDKTGGFEGKSRSFNKSGEDRNKNFDNTSRPFKKYGEDRPGNSEGRSRSFNKPGYERNRDFENRSRSIKSFDKRGDQQYDADGDAVVKDHNEEFEAKNRDFKYTKKHKFSPARKPASADVKDDGLIRLNRYISNSGICSRRKADELIAAGVISVNGEVVSELGTKVDPAKDEIRYNNDRLKREKMVYVLLNKPKDYITTTDDPQERRTVMQLVAKATKERIYPVGRLDRNTTGLLLLTNDGNLAEKLSHPRNSVTKIYQVELDKNLTQGDFNKIEFGVELEDGVIKPDDLSYVQGASKREVGIQIHSGKNRVVRRIFEHLGYEVIKLDRVVYANLTKKDLPRGRWRYLEERELVQLKHFIK